jgi:acetyl esterase/lipase
MRTSFWAGLVATFVFPLFPFAPQAAKQFEVEIIKDIAYKEGDGADVERHRLDLYLPKGQKDFPVLLFVHGGSWKSGNKKLYEPLGKLYAKNGVGTVIINYRLSPKVVHPAHIQDVAKAFAWIHTNIGKYGGDPSNLFICGHSAGGHLVALLGTNEAYLKAENLATADIKGVIGISGVYTILPSPPFKAVFGEDKEVLKTASPMEHVGTKHPPFLILYAEKDYFMLDVMAEQFCKKLNENSCEATVHKLAERDHISIIVHMASNEADPLNRRVFDFLAKHSGLKIRAK